jgi:phage nucleotide-binding protein
MSAQPESPRKLRIIQATDIVPVDHPLFLIYGQPSLGKTSLGFSAANAILLNFDTESALARAVNRGAAINVLSIDELRELEEGTDLLAPFSTVVIDPIGSCVNLMSADIIDRNPKYGRDGALSLQGFGVLKSRFKNWMTRLRSMNKDVLLIAHYKEDRDGDQMYVRPDITGSSKDEVMRLCDCVGFLFMNGKQRTLDFSPSDRWFAKNPAQWPAWKIPAPDQAKTFMAQLFQMAREALSKTSEASAKVANQVADWQAAIESYTTAEEFTKAVPEILKLAASPQAQVKKLLMERSKVLGFGFDTAKREFSAPQTVSAGW